MKTFFFACLTFVSLKSFALESGTYQCVRGNEESICPQIVRPDIKEGNLEGLRIYYSGYCNDQGPFYYACENGFCGDGTILFSDLQETTYRWENLPYGFACEFEKQSN